MSSLSGCRPALLRLLTHQTNTRSDDILLEVQSYFENLDNAQTRAPIVNVREG